MQQIDLLQRFKQEICTFEMAKTIKAAGMTCANTYFSYDKDGEVGDGAWLGDISEHYEIYPCVQFPFAVAMLDEKVPDMSEVHVEEDDGKYFISYRMGIASSFNIVDAILGLWLKLQ